MVFIDKKQLIYYSYCIIIFGLGEYILNKFTNIKTKFLILANKEELHTLTNGFSSKEKYNLILDIKQNYQNYFNFLKLINDLNFLDNGCIQINVRWINSFNFFDKQFSFDPEYMLAFDFYLKNNKDKESEIFELLMKIDMLYSSNKDSNEFEYALKKLYYNDKLVPLKNLIDFVKYFVEFRKYLNQEQQIIKQNTERNLNTLFDLNLNEFDSCINNKFIEFISSKFMGTKYADLPISTFIYSVISKEVINNLVKAFELNIELWNPNFSKIKKLQNKYPKATEYFDLIKDYPKLLANEKQGSYVEFIHTFVRNDKTILFSEQIGFPIFYEFSKDASILKEYINSMLLNINSFDGHLFDDYLFGDYLFDYSFFNAYSTSDSYYQFFENNFDLIMDNFNIKERKYHEYNSIFYIRMRRFLINIGFLIVKINKNDISEFNFIKDYDSIYQLIQNTIHIYDLKDYRFLFKFLNIDDSIVSDIINNQLKDVKENRLIN